MQLQGYSGCLVELIGEKEKVVKKTSPDIPYNKRLIQQKIKQETLRLEGFQNCRVYEEGYANGLYYFTMEYINGETLSSFTEQLCLSGMEDYADCLMMHFSPYISKNVNACNVFYDKVQQVGKNITASGKGKDGCISDALEALGRFDWSYVVESPCHGDLTMENILVSKGQLYLIDCLDSFYDSWMIDAAKLLQDAEFFWSYRNRARSANLIVRMTVFRDMITEHIRQMEYGEQLLNTVYHIVLLNMLRIIPYTNEDADFRYLCNAIKKLNFKLYRRAIS